MTPEAREGKKALRKDIKDRLSLLSGNDVAKQSRTAQQLILSLPQYRDARRLAIYLSMPGGEAQTDVLVRDALDHGKKVYVPYLYSVPKPGAKTGKGKVMDMLHLRSVEEYEGLEKDGWGIPSLSGASVEEREDAMGGRGCSLDADGSESGERSDGGLDLVVVPGVAFDAEMCRMGHGAGFYDSYLTRFCEGGKRKKPFLVGLCLAEQVVPSGQILMQDHDWKADAVAVGDGRLLSSQCNA